MDNLNILYTEEGESISSLPLPEYPRPALVRDSFFNLNGYWNFGVGGDDGGFIADRKILVPYPPESALSGIGEIFENGSLLCYERKFSLPEGFLRDRVILHFGAVDQVAEVFINGERVGSHIGGYEPFSFDITDHLSAENTLRVTVRDDLDSHILPYGKQKRDRGGMWYTPVSGIWQTVWLESVRKNHIVSLDLPTDPNNIEIKVNFSDHTENGRVVLHTEGGDITASLNNGSVRFDLDSPILWSPEKPYLYNFDIITESDSVSSYFTLRTLEIKTVDGYSRLCLNGMPYFFNGLLDQGYFPDGLFTPATYSCYEKDILRAKALGFNMIRKHIKIEPQRFYYLCDRLGMVVFQDMVNNGDYSFFRDTVLPTVVFLKRNDKRLHKNKKSREAFIIHMKQTVAQLKNFGCICLFTIFNEGWGQFCGSDAYETLKALDGSRFIDTASGWFTGCKNELDSRHIYFRRIKLKAKDKPLYLSEFGGYSFKVDGHVFNSENSYGYGTCKSREEFVSAFRSLYSEQVIPLVKKGLCAAVYTQLTDIEDEINGLITYDRRVEKITPEEIADIFERIEI